MALSDYRPPIGLGPISRQRVWAGHSVANFRVIIVDVVIGWRPLCHIHRSIDRFWCCFGGTIVGVDVVVVVVIVDANAEAGFVEDVGLDAVVEDAVEDVAKFVG